MRSLLVPAFGNFIFKSSLRPAVVDSGTTSPRKSFCVPLRRRLETLLAPLDGCRVRYGPKRMTEYSQRCNSSTVGTRTRAPALAASGIQRTLTGT